MFTQEQKVSHVGAKNLYTYSYNHHQIFRFTEQFMQIIFSVERKSYFVRSEYMS